MTRSTYTHKCMFVCISIILRNTRTGDKMYVEEKSWFGGFIRRRNGINKERVLNNKQEIQSLIV